MVGAHRPLYDAQSAAPVRSGRWRHRGGMATSGRVLPVGRRRLVGHSCRSRVTCRTAGFASSGHPTLVRTGPEKTEIGPIAEWQLSDNHAREADLHSWAQATIACAPYRGKPIRNRSNCTIREMVVSDTERPCPTSWHAGKSGGGGDGGCQGTAQIRGNRANELEIIEKAVRD